MNNRYNAFCIILSLLMVCNDNVKGEENQNKREILTSNYDKGENYKKYLLSFPLIITPPGYFIYKKLNNSDINENTPNLNQLKPLYVKKLNKVTLRIIKHGNTSTGLLVANTKDDPFVIKGRDGNNLATAIVSPNNQACVDGALAGAIENKGEKDVKDDKQQWIKEGKNKNLGIDDYTGNSIAIKYGEAKLGRSGNLKELKNIIHTVGPYVASGIPSPEKEKQLKNSYLNSCQIAAKNGIQRIVFPPISLGAFKFPSDEGTKIAIESIKDFSSGDTGNLEYIDIWMINDGNDYPFVIKATEILGHCKI